MKSLRIVTFLFIYSIITFLWLLYDRRTISEALQLPAIWVCPILMFIIGFLFSRLYSYFKKTKNEHFIWGHLTCLTCVFLFFIYTFVTDWHHDKQFGNFENNRANRDITSFPTDKVYQTKAYDALESNFPDKNSFRITDLFSDNIDTIINSVPTKIHVSWFEYYLNNEPKKYLCAKYYVFNDTIITGYLNEAVTRNFDFIKRKAYKDSLIKLVGSLLGK